MGSILIDENKKNKAKVSIKYKETFLSLNKKNKKIPIME
jgi:hypothetical protein